MEKLDKQKLLDWLDAIRDGIKRRDPYGDGIRWMNDATFNEIETGIFDIQEEQTDDQ